MTNLVKIRRLTKSYRRVEALRGVNLEIPEGRVTAFLGPNGAGKTTTIKCAMNLLDRDAGSIEVLGVDARKLGPGQFRRIGCVSENQQMPDWMNVGQLLDYLRPMYGEFWDREFERRLLKQFDIPPKVPLKNLSRGQRMKAALLSSLACRPKLVVLDEPFTGLDALVRDEFLGGLLELTEVEGWTVWISSHDIEEVERFADRVAILANGKVDLEEDIESLQGRFRAVEVFCEDDAKRPAQLPPDWLDFRVGGRTAKFVDTRFDEEKTAEAVRRYFPDVQRHEAHPMTLRDIFVALAKTYRLRV